jgi:tetratricopeptide (TPR) repeat protein
MSMPSMSSMPQSAATPLAFKFKFVRDGHEIGLRSKKGIIGPTGLQLDALPIAFDEIAETASRDNRLILALDPRSPVVQALQKVLAGNTTLALSISGAQARDLKRRIDQRNSARDADRHRQQLAAEGKDGLFRTAPCTHCQSTLDLSEMGRSSYVYCPYCETTLTGDGRVVASGDRYTVCDECRLFGRVQGYTEFYFYFLILAYGFSWKRRHVCDSCAQRMFTKTLLVNLVFLLGIPSAIWVKIKSMMGRDATYPKLAKANSLARKGQYSEAAPLYQRIYQTYPDHPGLLRNEALAHFNGKDVSGAMEYLNRALRACPTYAPAGESMQRLNAMLSQVAAGPSRQ